jgi:uncharacterized protein involved in cysteine biosynthesis
MQHKVLCRNGVRYTCFLIPIVNLVPIAWYILPLSTYTCFLIPIVNLVLTYSPFSPALALIRLCSITRHVASHISTHTRTHVHTH